MTSNLEKRKKEEEELAHPEDASNSSTFVCFDQYSHGEVATFCKLPVNTLKIKIPLVKQVTISV